MKKRSPNTSRTRAAAAVPALVLLLVAGLPLALYLACSPAGAGDAGAGQRRAGEAAGTINVRAGGDLQEAINRARPGDTIVLEAGATFSGNFRLPKKQGEAYVTIQSSRLAELPEGVRVSPAQSRLMPRIESVGRNSGAVSTEPGAHHYRFLGVEFTVRPGAVENTLILLGDSQETDPLRQPTEMVFDRCYIHAPGDFQMRRGIAVNSRKTEIVNSYISNIKQAGFETQAICGWNGPGPFRIVNNYLEASGENVMFGGARAQNERMNPADIEIRRNHFSKPVEWRGVYTVKNTFELKNARRVTVEGNTFENLWPDAQAGYAILFTPRPSDGGPTAAVEDVLFTNNIVRRVSAVFNITGSDTLYAAAPAEVRGRRITIRNNLFAEVSGEAWGGDGAFLKIGAGAEAVTVDHNTIIQTGNVTKAHAAPMPSFAFTNNVVGHNDFGVHGDDAAVGSGAIAMYFPRSTWRGNVFVGASPPAGPFPNPEERYPAGNFFARGWADVRMVNPAAGDYRLAAASPYRGRATDGKDVGCDFDELFEKVGARPAAAPR